MFLVECKYAQQSYVKCDSKLSVNGASTTPIPWELIKAAMDERYEECWKK